MKKYAHKQSHELILTTSRAFPEIRNVDAAFRNQFICTLIKLLILIIIPHANCLAQDMKSDSRSESLKEDLTNQFQADQIETVDILKALDILGVRIHKCDFGEFDSELEINLILEEYNNQEVVRKDTIETFPNTYYYLEIGKADYYVDYVKEMDIITKQSKNVLDLKFETHSMQRGTRIELKRERESQFYEVRFYDKSRPKGKVPLLIFASSWADSKVQGMERFCGVRQLRTNDPGTRELLESSANYFIVSYIITH